MLADAGCIDEEARHQVERARSLAAGTALAPVVDATRAQIEASQRPEQCELKDYAWPESIPRQ